MIDKDELSPDSAETWFPVGYSPDISTEQWLTLLADEKVFHPNNLAILKWIKDYGGVATCKQLSTKYGETANFYNAGSDSLLFQK